MESNKDDNEAVFGQNVSNIVPKNMNNSGPDSVLNELKQSDNHNPDESIEEYLATHNDSILELSKNFQNDTFTGTSQSKIKTKTIQDECDLTLDKELNLGEDDLIIKPVDASANRSFSKRSDPVNRSLKMSKKLIEDKIQKEILDVMDSEVIANEYLDEKILKQPSRELIDVFSQNASKRDVVIESKSSKVVNTMEAEFENKLTNPSEDQQDDGYKLVNDINNEEEVQVD